MRPLSPVLDVCTSNPVNVGDIPDDRLFICDLSLSVSVNESYNSSVELMNGGNVLFPVRVWACPIRDFQRDSHMRLVVLQRRPN
jgi:hypothetical protein